jgi:outer membrane protein
MKDRTAILSPLNIPLLILFTISFQFSKAQETDTIKHWRLQDCITYAFSHNITINSLKLEQLTDLQNLDAARGVKIPSLSGSVGNTFNNANNSNGTGGRVNQLSNSGSYSLNSSVILWDDHAISNTIRQEGLISQSAGLSVQQSQNNISLSITQAFLNVLLAKENLTYIKNLVSTSDSLVKQGQLFFEAGSIAKVALLQLQAQLATDKYLLVQTQNSVRLNLLNLKQILQLPAETPFDIAIPENVLPVNEVTPLAVARQSALDNFPDSKIGKLGLDIASINIANAKAAFKPVLKANGSMGSGYSYALTNANLPKTNYFTQTGNNFYQNVGVSLSVPIFSQRVNRTNLEKSKIAYSQATLNLQNTQLVLSQVVEQAYLAALNALQSYNAAGEQLTFAQESYRIGNEEFKLGAIDAYALLQLRNQYVQAVQSYTQGKYTAILEQKIYEFYMGIALTL